MANRLELAADGVMPGGGIVYHLLGDGDELLYVGFSAKGLSRSFQHSGKAWWKDVRAIEWQVFNTAVEAYEAEGEQIRDLRPRHNKFLRGVQDPGLEYYQQIAVNDDRRRAPLGEYR